MTAHRLGGRDVVVAGLALSLGFAFAAARSPVLALAAMISVIAIAWIVSRAELVLLVLVAALPWEAMLHYPSATVSTVKLIGLALAAAYVFRAGRRGESVRLPPTIVLALLFGMVVGLSLIASTEPSVGVSKAFRYAFFIGFLFLVVQLVTDRREALRLLRVFCLSAAAAGLVGLVSFLSGSITRAGGPIEDPNDFAYLLATTIPIAALLFKEDRGWRVLWATSSALLLGATLATLSRGALVGLAALLGWAVVTRRIGPTWIVWSGLATAALIAVAIAFWSPLVNERLTEKNNIGERNVASRAAFWSAAERMSYERPLLGIGPGMFGREAHNYVRNNPIALTDPVVHNSYLEVLAEDGVAAFLLYAGMLASAWLAVDRFERISRRQEDIGGERLATALKGMLLVAIVSGFFLSEQVAPPIWLACALAASGALATEPIARRSAAPLASLG